MQIHRSRPLTASICALLLVCGCTTGSLKLGDRPDAVQATAAAINDPAIPGADDGAVAPLGYAAPDVTGLIAKYAIVYDVPETLIHRMVQRESGYNAAARNGPFWGLMQIRHDTAATMGYRGPAAGLLNPDTNLKYAVKYLRGAYLVADRDPDRAVGFYSRGYYYDAKRKGLLDATGLR